MTDNNGKQNTEVQQNHKEIKGLPFVPDAVHFILVFDKIVKRVHCRC